LGQKGFVVVVVVVWMKGGRELADEVIKKNEKETHEA
jgi:hypothetical protein